MSFYDSASLAFLPSGGAGKDGKAYSIKPVPEYGNELVTNGGFYTDSDWTKGTGWTISGGAANCDGTQTSTSQLKTSVGLSIQNTLVEFSFELKNYSAGTLTATIEGTGGNEFSNINSNGVYTIQATSSDLTPRIAFNADSSFIGSIDNVSVKEVIVDGDFTFSRGSNLTATRVDSNGIIEKGRENLLTYSNDFSNAAWDYTTNGVTRTASSITDPDGGTNAWEITTTATNEHHRLGHNITSGLKTISFYAKANGYEYVRFWAFSGGNTGSNYFHLSGAGTAVANGQLGIASIESVGNGWYRCQGVLDPLNSSAVVISPAPDASKAAGTGTYLADGTSGIYLYNAQLEAGLVATEYIESGATTGLAGILEDSPRFDYSGGASCPSLLLEPSRSNLITSEYLPLMSIIGSPIITPNATTSPEGYQNMAEFSSSATSDRYQKNLGVLSGQHTFSAFFKYSGTDKSVYLRMSDTSSRLKVDIASSGVTIDSGGSSNIDDSDVIDYGNGIYRAYMVFTPSTGTTFAQFYPSATDTSGSIYAYGFQMEQGSYPTSYIPNHSGGSVTRNAENCSGAGNSSTFNDTEGVLYAEIAAIADDQTSKVISLSDGTFDERVLISTHTGGSNQIRVFIKSGGSFSATIDVILNDITDYNKIAYRYKSGETKLFVNGSLISTSTDTFSISGLNALQFASGTSTAVPFYGNAKQVIVFNTALSDADLEILTGTSYESFAAMATALNYTTYE